MNIEQSWSRATCAQCGNKVPTEVPRLAGWIEELTRERDIYRDGWDCKQAELREQLAASQAREKMLREALIEISSPIRQQDAVKAHEYDLLVATEALALPQDSSALDARLAEERENIAVRVDRWGFFELAEELRSMSK